MLCCRVCENGLAFAAAAMAALVDVLLAERIGQSLARVQDKIYLPARADGKPRELRLQLSREPLSVKTNDTANPTSPNP